MLAQHASRIAALPGVSSFEEMTGEEAEGIDNCYAGLAADGSVIGYVVQSTAKGYGGGIEVIVPEYSQHIGAVGAALLVS